MKAVVAAFNQEKALIGAFSVIVKTDCETDGALHSTTFRRLCSSVRAQKLLEWSQINVNKQNGGKLRIYLHCSALKGLYPAFYDKGHDERTFVHVECFLGQKWDWWPTDDCHKWQVVNDSVWPFSVLNDGYYEQFGRARAQLVWTVGMRDQDLIVPHQAVVSVILTTFLLDLDHFGHISYIITEKLQKSNMWKRGLMKDITSSWNLLGLSMIELWPYIHNP